MKIKIDDLIKKFPWTDHPLICIFAESFSVQQWQEITDTKIIHGLITKDQLTDEHLFQLMRNTHDLINSPHIKQHLIKKELNLKQLLEFQINPGNKQLINQSPARFGTFRSSINYLFSLNFNKQDLKKILMDFFLINFEYAMKHINEIAGILCQSDKSIEQKQEILEKSLIHSINQYPKECLGSFLKKDVNKYQLTPSGQKECKSRFNSIDSFFKPKMQIEDLTQHLLPLYKFFNYCNLFLSSFENPQVNKISF